MGPLADDEPFITEDFTLLEKYTSKVFVDKLLDKANALNLDGARYCYHLSHSRLICELC
jgi:hypothetical protein